MKLIFLGSFFPNELEAVIRERSKGPVANANNALQWSYLNGLGSLFSSFDVITLPHIGAYPLRYKDLFFRAKSSEFIINNKISAWCIDFFNLVLFKHLHRYIQTRRILSKLLTQTSENSTIIVYDLHAPFINAVKKIRESNKHVKICVIVPDIPFMTGAPDNILYKTFQNIENFFLKRSYDCIDMFVLLSRHMTDKLPINNKPCIVIEGIYNPDDELINQTPNSIINEKRVFYSGALDKRNGIINLVDAFRQINDADYRLIICGDGEERKYVTDASAQDSRILYKGQLPRKEVLTLQRESTLLVNPRPSGGEFTRYSFPSKTMEYFASGVPVLMFEIEGIPEEYYSYCYTIKKNTISDLKDEILMICGKDSGELQLKGDSARKFILENKNPVHQCLKLVNLINENAASD